MDRIEENYLQEPTIEDSMQGEESAIGGSMNNEMRANASLSLPPLHINSNTMLNSESKSRPPKFIKR